MSAAADRMQLLRAAGRGAVPWKNGGGVTREIVAHPPGSDLGGFHWRISSAEVRAAGPFSVFPGIDRIIVILAGELSLVVDGQAPVLLSPQSAPWHFAGDVATSGAPVAGVVHDLNVMTRRGGYAARVQRCVVQRRARFSFSAATTVVVAAAELVVEAPETSFSLARLDALRIAGPLECEFAGVLPGACFYRIEITPGGASA